MPYKMVLMCMFTFNKYFHYKNISCLNETYLNLKFTY